MSAADGLGSSLGSSLGRAPDVPTSGIELSSALSSASRGAASITPSLVLTELLPSEHRDSASVAAGRARLIDAAASSSEIKESWPKLKLLGKIVVGALFVVPFGVLNILTRIVLVAGAAAGAIAAGAAGLAVGLVFGAAGFAAGLLVSPSCLFSKKTFLEHMKEFTTGGAEVGAKMAFCAVAIPTAVVLYVPCFLSAKLSEGSIFLLDALGADRRKQAILREIFAVDPLEKIVHGLLQQFGFIDE